MRIFSEKEKGEGTVDGVRGLTFGIVVSRFNETITSALLEGAVSVLREGGTEDNAVTVLYVPGAYEIPLAAEKMASSGKYSAVIALGCVIRGETVHFDVICESVGKALLDVSLKHGIPVTSGIVMAENENQAMERAGGAKADRGSEAAQAALETALLFQSYGE